MLKIDCNIFEGSVLLAVSGGIDSVVMAHLVCDKLQKNNPSIGLAIAHCNFRLRGEESDGDEAFVKDFAASLGVRCFSKSFDTSAFARQNGVSIEMAARELRYRWFAELCQVYGFDGVCVAHNANDNAETLVLNLLRGTGLRGICGMKAVSANPYAPGDYPESGHLEKGSKVYRPMLGFTRAEIEDYAVRNGLEWRTDSSNASDDYKRNIVRNQIFPLFQRINPSFVHTLNRDMENFALVGQSQNHQLAMEMLDAGFNGAVIRDVMALLQSGRTASGKTFYSKTHVLVIGADGIEIRPLAGVSASHLLFCEGSETVTPNIERMSAIGDSDPAGKSRWETPGLIIELIDWRPEMDPKAPRGVTLVDAAKLGGEPVLRKWQEGDWMNPIGMKGRKKVSDILTELKYNVLDKKEVLVLAGEDSHVLAVIGERVDRSVMIDKNTTTAYRISVK